ncbi:hypothetical protein [Vibrio rumoiensis]|uniref:hypothetical protein n=1 Tax=Vibrio rumoiensis TaxID=76258 RepID=UPI003AA9AFFE
MVYLSPKHVIFGGMLLSVCLLNSSPAASYKAFQSRDRHIVTLSGRFESGESYRFQQFLANHKNTQFILLQSNGGSIKEAMKVGRIIHQKSLNTLVETYCYSSCFVVLMSGQIRYVYENAYLGVHQPYFVRKNEWVGDKKHSSTYDHLTQYFQFMLGNRQQSQEVVNLIYKTPPNSMHQINHAEPYLKLHYYSHPTL